MGPLKLPGRGLEINFFITCPLARLRLALRLGDERSAQALSGLKGPLAGLNPRRPKIRHKIKPLAGAGEPLKLAAPLVGKIFLDFSLKKVYVIWKRA